MPAWLRRSLIALAVVALLLLGAGWWLQRSFDAVRIQRSASDWMQTRFQRELSFGGPVSLRLWPQPALDVAQVRLSESGQPQQRFASIEQASLTLELAPLLQREIAVDRIAVHGLQMRLQRDAGGRRNIDDLLSSLTDSRSPQGGSLVQIERLEVAGATLQVDDAATGAKGAFTVDQLTLDHFGSGGRWPLKAAARAALQQPALAADLQLRTAIELLPAADPALGPGLRLHDTVATLAGSGFDAEQLNARLQAATISVFGGTTGDWANAHAELEAAQLQLDGRWRGWQVSSAKLGLKSLQLRARNRTLQFEQLALQVSARDDATTLEAQLDWPALKVVGASLQGGPVTGKLTLGGDRTLQLQLRSSQPAGGFERFTLPGLEADIDGRLGPSALQGQAKGALAFETASRTLTLQPIEVSLRLTEPTLPPLQLALNGETTLTPRGASSRLQGSINDQQVQARVDVALDRARPFIDADASFGTLDVERFVAPPARGAAPAPAAVTMPVNLQALRSADARLNLRVAQLLRRPYRVDGLALRASVDGGRLDLQQLSGRAFGGRFEAGGSADAAGNAIALRLRGDDVDVRALLADTTGYDGLSGRGRVEADLRSRGATMGALRSGLAGSARLSLRPAALRGFDLGQTLRAWRTASETQTGATRDAARQTEFGQLDASFRIEGGVARGDDLDARSEFLRVGGEGTIDLGRGEVNYLLRTRVVNTSSARAGPEMAMLNGVTVPVDLRGPFGAVQWQVRWPAVTAAVAAMSVPNVVRGAAGVGVGVVGGVARGAAGVAGAIGRGIGQALPPAASAPAR